ncbi:transcription elongation factor Spt5 [Candidatus Nitrosocosmicus agrestis]|jgi:transcriptional antiterminator NusG|uniref:transcription elongation factor Spt5 n=1 Tax=Candidatus Nitrosocosmicus agrestis TaxID=2563600 RepID=UPI00122E867E|nr:transcription elongation factor Spt5 [Candidatus Nitrosocosmicus sp. SS]KAA2280779.1 transcription elongation factor Spt5 [Candidatus Nitrosocosmicus sp. SS]KAF0868864.1 transcription elongation factor Spt5 [Candidatus Nitrosocosmicus sp. SS]MDR4492169.1 transcription elongation factor Spt5 [Candidatus Nitrosocosmicus sp.]
MPKDLRYDDDEIDFDAYDRDAEDSDFNNNADVGTKPIKDSNTLGIEHSKKNLPKKNTEKYKSTSNQKRTDSNNQNDVFNEILSGEDQDETVSDLGAAVLDDDDSKFFVVRVAGGQENMIASMLQTRLNTKKIDGIYSVLFLDSFKGYVIVEAIDSNIAYEALHGIRHIRGQIRGELPFKDLEGYLIKKPVVTELIIDDTVEIIAGPFKSMKAKITRVDYEKQEATVVLLDSPYQIPVTVDANYLKKSL